jgi:hypothetical protein
VTGSGADEADDRFGGAGLTGAGSIGRLGGGAATIGGGAAAVDESDPATASASAVTKAPHVA